MSSTVVVLDESGKHKGHSILSVGGFVADLPSISQIELSWRTAKESVDIAPGARIKYAMRWEDPSVRAKLIEEVGRLPISALVVLLEDFRPIKMRIAKPTRSDLYIHRKALDYLLQRLASDLFVSDAGGPHFVVFDERSDLPALQDAYAEVYARGWMFGSRTVPSLESRGFSETLMSACGGALLEIADLIVSGMTHWATARCAAHKGGAVANLDELDSICRSMIRLFPASSGVPPRRRGYSIVTHTKNLTGRELLRDNIDRWIEEACSESRFGYDILPYGR